MEELNIDLLSDFEFLEKQTALQRDIDRYTKDEEEINKQLKNVLSEQVHVFAKLRSIEKLFPSLKILKDDAKNLCTTMNNISESSENVCGKISKLDAARNRVLECQQRVSDLIDLELCSQGVLKAIENEDYEKGAGHVHRFLSMDQSLLERTANDVAKNATSVAQSVATLQEATRQLQSIIKHQFDEAVKKEDVASIERFFKIFPLLGMHEEGLHKFSIYLCSKLQETSQKNLHTALNTNQSDKRYNVVYADTLTLLFEGIARLIETHQPLIETYYGLGRLFSSVHIIQKECDRQCKRILAEFIKYRQVNKKINHITDIQRMSSSSSFNKIEKIDPKELDTLIGEITIMHSRTELYIRFLKRRLTNDIDIGYTDLDLRAKKLLEMEAFLKASELSQTKHELLGNYLRLEQYFMEESMTKAVSLDAIEEGQQTSSMVDDVFFIIRKCVRRAIAASSLDGVCAVINNACTILETEYCDVLRSQLKQGYPSGYLDLTQAYNVLQTSIQQGRLQPGDTEHTRTLFIIALNNADISIEYVDTLCNTLMQEITGTLPGMSANEKGKLESCLSGLSAVTTNLKTVIDYGMQQLRASAIKPRINPWVDGFISINHELSEDELSTYEAGESFVQTLIMNLDTLLSSFKDCLTTSNYETLVSILTTDVTARLEKAVFKSTFNRLGGLVLDKEVRSLASYLTAATSWSVRDKFARLTQMATVLNLERVSEIYDYWGSHSGALTWRLTPGELRQVMSLRTDFKVDDIRRLKL